MYVQGTVSDKRWEPIFNVRGRPPWVQTAIFDLLKQLKALRSANASLPSIDTLSLPSHRQLVVSFGDLDALCDSVEFILDQCGALGVAYGGPDDRGTLWIKFYKMLAEDRTRDNQLQFIIWINYVKYPSIAEEHIKSVYEHMESQIRPMEATPSNYQREIALYQMHGPRSDASRRWSKESTARESFGANISFLHSRERSSTDHHLKPKTKAEESPTNQSTGGDGRGFPDGNLR